MTNIQKNTRKYLFMIQWSQRQQSASENLANFDLVVMHGKFVKY